MNPASIQRKCPECGAPVDPDTPACPGCERDLADLWITPRSPPRPIKSKFTCAKLLAMAVAIALGGENLRLGRLGLAAFCFGLALACVGSIVRGWLDD